MDVINLINTGDIATCLRAGRAVASTDYAVRFYNNKNHPQFYKNDDLLRHAVRRAIAAGDSETMARVLGEFGIPYDPRLGSKKFKAFAKGKGYSVDSFSELPQKDRDLIYEEYRQHCAELRKASKERKEARARLKKVQTDWSGKGITYRQGRESKTTKQFDVKMTREDYEICERYGFAFERNFEEMVKNVARQLREGEKERGS